MSEGLSYILERDTVNYIARETTNTLWAEDIPSKNKIPYKCCIRGAEDTTPINTKEGKQLLPTYIISFNGNINFSVGDFLEVDNRVMQILHIKAVRDFIGTILFTKVKV